MKVPNINFGTLLLPYMWLFHGRGVDQLFIPVYGHIRSHCSVAVKMESRWLLQSQDANTEDQRDKLREYESQ